MRRGGRDRRRQRQVAQAKREQALRDWMAWRERVNEALDGTPPRGGSEVRGLSVGVLAPGLIHRRRKAEKLTGAD
jgi:hypothetical protein